MTSRISKTTIGIGIAVLVIFFMGFSGYNTLVNLDEAAATAWGNVQTQYQRRADLIPSLVNTVKGYAKHESATLEGVVAARAKATSLQVSADDLTPEKMKQIQQAQGELSQAIGRLLMITENYPDLKASENFSELQAQLEGTENRINESRQLYNKSVQEYNQTVRRFPSNIIATLCGFDKRTLFEADAAAQKAPTVEF